MFGPELKWGILIERFHGCAMRQVLHGSATRGVAVRRAIQQSEASLRALARRHGVNPKTIAKWNGGPRSQICLRAKGAEIDGS